MKLLVRLWSKACHYYVKKEKNTNCDLPLHQYKVMPNECLASDFSKWEIKLKRCVRACGNNY